MTNHDLAEMLGRRLASLGHDARLIQQIDFVPCEDEGRTTMAYNYLIGGECVPLYFDSVPFDPTEVEALLKGGVAAGALH
jgi:hypothetical protein